MTAEELKQQDASDRRQLARQPDDQVAWERGYTDAGDHRDRQSDNPHYLDGYSRRRLEFSLERV